MTIKVLIADDHIVVRQGLKMLLDSQASIQVVGEAADGAMAVELAERLQPDVILMDLLMPELNGIEATRLIVQKRLPSKVLILTSSLEDQLVKQALQVGARGYVLKAIRTNDLVQAIERVAQGQSILDPAATQLMLHSIQHQEPLETLTIREREVFDHLARGLSNPEIASVLNVSEATIRTHIASVLDKLALRDRTQVIIYALKRGLIHVNDLP
jgi:DNA-binding NarL/FixJ family response regulator